MWKHNTAPQPRPTAKLKPWYDLDGGEKTVHLEIEREELHLHATAVVGVKVAR